MDIDTRVKGDWEAFCTRYEADLAEPDKLVEVEVWRTEFKNLVVTAGLNHYLESTLRTGITPAWYGLLKDTGTVVTGDTLSSHGGWTENQTYSNANRPTWTPNGAASAGSISNSNSPMAFAINGTTTIYGAGLCNNATKASTTGVLLAAGDFSGSQAVQNGDTLNVTCTCSMTAA